MAKFIGVSDSRITCGKIRSDVRDQLDYARELEIHAIKEISR